MNHKAIRALAPWSATEGLNLVLRAQARNYPRPLSPKATHKLHACNIPPFCPNNSRRAALRLEPSLQDIFSYRDPSLWFFCQKFLEMTKKGRAMLVGEAGHEDPHPPTTAPQHAFCVAMVVGMGALIHMDHIERNVVKQNFLHIKNRQTSEIVDFIMN